MLKCYVQGRVVPKLVPARPHREWMDRFPERHPYRCLPLAIANTFGWELLSPCDLKIEWNGKPGIADIKVSAEDGFPLVDDFALSNFACGIVSFHTGYLFVTDPGWAMIATGPLNEPREGMTPLTGLIETEWLPYPFGMNWQLTRPGVHRIRKGEAFCHLMPVQIEPLVAAEPEIFELTSNPELEARLASYRERRKALRAKQREQPAADGPEPPSWAKEYFQGQLKDGSTAPKHYHKLRLKEPLDRRIFKTEEVVLQQAQAAAAGTPEKAAPFGLFGYRPPKEK